MLLNHYIIIFNSISGMMLVMFFFMNIAKKGKMSLRFSATSIEEQFTNKDKINNGSFQCKEHWLEYYKSPLIPVKSYSIFRLTVKSATSREH